jgi:hypothetical protein
MRIKKKDLNEIIDSNGELIGNKDTPTTGGDLESAANGTTDQNVGKGQQPFRYDMLGRFGFTMMPFMEGKSVQEQSNFMQELISLMHGHYAEILEYYYRNPNKLKPDFRKSQEEGHGHSDECEKRDIVWANEVMEKIQKELENAFQDSKQIDESIVVEDNVVEDKLVDKKSEEEISNKTEDKGVRDSKLEKIAGLIDKLDKESKDKLKNLLERKNG